MSKSIKFFTIHDLVKKLEKIASENRYDQVSRTICDVYEKVEEKNPQAIISSVDIKNIYGTVYNLNPNTNFSDKMNDVFDDKNTETFVESSPFRVAGFSDDFRPTPVEIVKTEEEIIKDSSFENIKKIIANNVVYPQYHYNQFIKVASVGKNSGIALWKISFNTKCGEAKINIPVAVLNGEIVQPKVFYAANMSKPLPLTAQSLKDFSFSYNPPTRKAQTELSGFEYIGNNPTLLTDKQDIQEGSGSKAETSISIGYSIPVDESLTSNVGDVEKEISEAIEQARKMVEKKIKNGEDDELNIHLQITYTGGLGIDGEELVAVKNQPVEGVFAFNASQNTRNGLKTITVPVMITNNKCIANSFYTEAGVKDLSAENVSDYFNSQNEEKPETDSFSGAFLAYLKKDATYSEIVGEIKEMIKRDDIKTAASYLQIISDRFGDKAFNTASNNFVDFVKEASDKKDEESNLSYFGSTEVNFRGNIL